MKKTTWRVEQDGKHRIVLTNNRNSSYYEYRQSSKAEFLADQLPAGLEQLDMRQFTEMLKAHLAAWVLRARDQDGNLLPMYEYTLGPNAEDLGAKMLDEATHLAGYLTRHGIREAQDGPHLHAQWERNPPEDFQCAPARRKE